MNKVKLTANILFSGIGCQERGFENSNLFDVEVINTSEINKEAVLSYAAIHCGLTNEMVDIYKDYPSREEMARQLTEINLGYEPEKNKKFDWYKLARRKSNDIEKYWLASKLTNNLGDISRIDKLSYADLWTISSPCQSISVAGKMDGLEKGSGTRSSLVWDSARLLQKAKEDSILPKYLLMENVKNLVSKKFKEQFDMICNTLDEIGFNVYWKVLNAKDCGIPQNRERVFLIGIRKDIDNGTYEFPKPFDTGIRLKDVLDKEVDEKYYLSDTIIKGFEKHNENHKAKGTGFIWKTRDLNGVASTLRGNAALAPTDNTINDCIQVGNLNHYNYDEMNRVYSEEGCCPTLRTMQGGDRQPRVLEPKINVVGNYNPSGHDASRIVDIEGISPTVKENHGTVTAVAEPQMQNFRIRKLTPNECFKLMGLTETDFIKAKSIGISDSQLYKQAGNGIVTNCVELLAEHLHKAQYDNTYVCTDENFQIPQNLTAETN